MKKSLLLIAVLMLAVLTSCGAAGINSGHSQNGGSVTDEIILPPLDGMEYEVVDFNSITYARPSTDAVIEKTKELSVLLDGGDIDYDGVIEMISEIDTLYAEFDTMLSLLMIRSSEDLTDESTSEEYEYLQSKAPSVERAVDELLVELARSPFATRLEEEVFGEGFIEEYIDGSRFTDHITALLEEEAALEAEYLTLDSASAAERGADIFIELLKIRKQLADAYGYESYSEYAYEALGHDYSAEDMSALCEDIARFALPIYTALSQRAFYGYFKTHRPPTVSRAEIVNDLYTVLSSLDEDIGLVYSYMLNGSLYSIEEPSDERRPGAFTLYLSSAEVPFTFVTLDGTPDGYMILTHEFGHFYDDFTNYGGSSSLDLCEVSSQALELLALTRFKDTLSTEEYKYLYYMEMERALQSLIIQAFYARFEALAYELSYENITKENLDRLVIRAAEEMHLNTKVFGDLSDAVIVHLIDTPFYVQSYCTSLIAALDIFFKECDAEGDGVAAYMALINTEPSYGFKEALTRAGIASPFDEDIVKRLADEVHYSILGSHYYKISDNYQNAA